MDTLAHTNRLINETSPYLVQHAHNPVDWYPWGGEALAKAEKENKPIIISIGYSACHWCHVMAHESFEDEEVAKIMNNNFVCIKVDREERPDIDQIYMSAVQLITGSGGWPLNCFALPDGRPFTGGTYFPKEHWKETLLKISSEYQKNPVAFLRYAEALTQGVKTSEIIDLNPDETGFTIEELKDGVEEWKKQFDNQEGGSDRAPKFPLPNNYLFLLRYAHLAKDDNIQKHVHLTLQKMAYGGIYDHIGGGFARYSTDKFWKVPHFEKMLYDNALLVSLYSEAYRATKNTFYKQAVYETLDFIKREMTSPEGMFFSGLDADSEGEEGKYYIWTLEELQHLLGERYELFAAYFNVNEHGLWEDGKYILLRKDDEEKIAGKFNITEEKLQVEIGGCKKIILEERGKRVHPALDDKSLTSWNALMAKGYLDAYTAFNEESFLQSAEKNIRFILSNLRLPDGGLFHSWKNGNSKIPGFLEDYAFTIEALISLYEATFDPSWLKEAKKLADYVILNFYDESSGMFFFTPVNAETVITRKTEVYDNVIPSSNSSLAKGLFYLGTLFDNVEYIEKSKQMLNNMRNHIGSYTSGYSNWAILMLHHLFPFYEIAIAGKEAHQRREELNRFYIPNRIILGEVVETIQTENEIKVPLLENKFVTGETLIYACFNKTCKLPVKEASKAIKQMEPR
ncbi:MAG: thioredoxin domain-containing protein [Bacteroidetes bacterium]|nr:thioredoxin domain-containing protein [Bacteroidota bacterium]